MWKNTVEPGGGRGTDENMAHAHCILDNYGNTHTLTICNTYCFSTATTVKERTSMLRYSKLPVLFRLCT